MIRRLVISVGVFLSAFSLNGQTSSLPKEMTGFLKEYCIKCHGPKKSKGDFRVDKLGMIKNVVQAEEWQLVLDNLHLGEMPPEDEKRPGIKELNKYTEWIEAELRKARKVLKGHTGEVVLRRLNRQEYAYTIQDIFGDHRDLTASFPEDAKEDGFSNNGASLMLSSTQINEYMKAADKILTEAMKVNGKPKFNDLTFTLNDKNKDDWKRQPKDRENKRKELDKLPPKEQKDFLDNEARYEKDVYWNYVYPVWENGQLRAPKPDDKPGTDYAYYKKGFGWQDPSPQVYIERPGRYRFTITGYAARSNGKDIRVKAVYGRLHNNATIPKLAGYAYFKPEKPQTFTFDFYLQPGELLRVVEASEGSGWRRTEDILKYDGPMAIIQSMRFEGPFYDSWPSKSYKNVFGDVDLNKLNNTTAKQIITNIAPKLFRRKVEDSVVEKYYNLYLNFAKKDKLQDALKATLKAMMVSPRFLYHYEGKGNIDDYALASRLSYFLWRSTPDEELLNLAEKGQLKSKSVLKAQVDRMLKDKKSERFVNDFTSQWLQTYKIGEMIPDKKLYPEYDPFLEEAMKEETHGYINEMLRNNQPIDDLIDSNWSIMNERLAQHYGIEGVSGLHFRKVKLDRTKTVRGGLLTHAAIHNITSNGTTTSPVIRGVWMLEHFLGTPSPPPPPDVPAIEPDIRGATTIKEQLLKHREIETCKECHKKIDPFGVALENFDVVGSWRENYKALKPDKNNRMKLADGKPVEVSDSIPSMGSYGGFEQFRSLLKQNRKLIYHNVAHKMATFALGRSMNFSDREYLEQIVLATAKNDKGFKTMLYELVLNPIFVKP